MRVSTEISAKWSELQSRISADEKTLAACRSGGGPCSQAELRFLSIVEIARKGNRKMKKVRKAVSLFCHVVEQFSCKEFNEAPLFIEEFYTDG